MQTISNELLYKFYQNASSISIDSRRISKGCLFFALKGENFNGNAFAEDALKKGAYKVVVDEEEYVKDDNFLLVENGLKALQELAKYHRSQLQIPIIGITGSNGKTTTKELVTSVLKQHYKCYATVANYNNHIGVPMSILSIQKDDELAVIEMGANHQGEIKFLCNIAQPNYGLITNIGKSHLEGFGGFEGVIKGKSELYDFLRQNQGKVFINADDELLTKISKDLNTITYGTSDDYYCMGKLIQTHPTVKAEWKCGNNKGKVNAQLYGAYNFTNIMAALCIGNYFKVPTDKINQALENYQSKNNRSQLIINGAYKIYLDAYNANPSSMKYAIENFSENKGEEKWLILGDMFEVGPTSPKEHQNIIELIKSLNISNSCFIGENFYQWKSTYDEFIFFESISKAKSWFKKLDKNNKQFLIKGSRGVGLERLIA